MTNKKRVAIVLGAIGYAAVVVLALVSGTLVVTVQALERLVAGIFGG